MNLCHRRTVRIRSSRRLSLSSTTPSAPHHLPPRAFSSFWCSSRLASFFAPADADSPSPVVIVLVEAGTGFAFLEDGFNQESWRAR
ncbi:hypothetical protein E2562_036526 [Oryza meyeriana var. granulata]|uniref:Uncharacterized protein n=1 Tax=Oryza meyeriana var. granulata TaxID=110450 RepID=A0A6G1FG32_9ORYZ|nr:hypothetical protein E2562_036526 [Oryza meyeriana var. granulata]